MRLAYIRSHNELTENHCGFEFKIILHYIMNQTINQINSIISDLVDSTTKLQDTLLRVKVLAFKIKNDKLKVWVDNELNGFVDNEVPSYRNIETNVVGNIIQDRGFGMLTNKNYTLPIEYIEKELRSKIKHAAIKNSISELAHMIEGGGRFQIIIPHMIHSKITKILANDWVVEEAWQEVGLNQLEGIFSSVKSKLLSFLLELADEIGENENIEIIENKSRIDKLFEKTIGNLTGETINIVIGSDNIQAINTGENANFNIAKGENIKQTINFEAQQELSNFILSLKDQIENLSLAREEKEDILSEIARIETQLQREKPKYPIINSALNIVNGILIGVAGNVSTQPIIEKLGWLIGQFS